MSVLNPANTHTHPFFSGTGNNLVVPSLPGPEDLDASAGSYLELRLTATDSQGAQRTITQTVEPNRVLITLNTQPQGLKVKVNDSTHIGPQAITSWENYPLNVSAPIAQESNGTQYAFASWSDGGAASHTINTTAQAAARFGDSSDMSISYPITFSASALYLAELMGNSIGGTGVVCRDDRRCAFRPSPDGDSMSTLQSFAGFVGQSAQGQWQVCLSDLAAKDIGRITSATLDLTCKAPGLTVVTPEPMIEPTTTPFPEVTPEPDALKPEELDVKYQVWVPVVISMDTNGSTDGNGSTDDPTPTGNP